MDTHRYTIWVQKIAMMQPTIPDETDYIYTSIYTYTSVVVNSLQPMTPTICAQESQMWKVINSMTTPTAHVQLVKSKNRNISTYIAVAVHSSVSITALTHTQWCVALSIDTRRYTIWKQKNCNQTLNYTRRNNKLHTPLQLSKVKPHSAKMIIHVTISSLVYNNYGTWTTHIKAVMWGWPMPGHLTIWYDVYCLMPHTHHRPTGPLSVRRLRYHSG